MRLLSVAPQEDSGGCGPSSCLGLVRWCFRSARYIALMRFALSTAQHKTTWDRLDASCGQGERRTLRAVARWADHWNAPALDADTFARKLEVLHRHCADIGRDPSTITVSNLVRYDGTDGVLEQIDRFGALGVDLLVVAVPSPHDPDDVSRLGELLASAR